MHRCVLSALLFISLLWLSDVLYRYIHAAPLSRQNLRLPLGSCVVACLCGIIVLVLSELQLHGDETRKTLHLYRVVQRLIEVRE